MPLSKKLAREIREEIQRDPLTATELLGIVQEALAAWQQRTLATISQRADMGISAALGLPASKSRNWLQVNNKKHRDWARMTAIGWNLHRRLASSSLEKDLVEFVRSADAADPNSALSHYQTLLGEEFPMLPTYRVWGEEADA
jgi:hypothetical protein